MAIVKGFPQGLVGKLDLSPLHASMISRFTFGPNWSRKDMRLPRCGPNRRRRAGNSSLLMVLTGVGGTLAAIGAAIICSAIFGSVESKAMPTARMLIFGAGFIGAGMLPILAVLCFDIVVNRLNRRRIWKREGTEQSRRQGLG